MAVSNDVLDYLGPCSVYNDVEEDCRHFFQPSMDLRLI